MSARDIYDERRWDPKRGVMVGVNYGGTVHQPRTTYSDIPFGGGPFLSTGPKYGEDYDPYRATPPFAFPKSDTKFPVGFPAPGDISPGGGDAPLHTPPNPLPKEVEIKRTEYPFELPKQGTNDFYQKMDEADNQMKKIQFLINFLKERSN